MVEMTTLPDDTIAEARARLADLEAESAERRDAVAAARAELELVEAGTPFTPGAARRPVEETRWQAAVAAAQRRQLEADDGARNRVRRPSRALRPPGADARGRRGRRAPGWPVPTVGYDSCG